MKIEESDKYVDRFDQEVECQKMFDEVLEEITNVGLVQIKEKEIIMYDKFYQVQRIEERGS